MEKLYKNSKLILMKINIPFTNENKRDAQKTTLTNVLIEKHCKKPG